ncbi:MAG: flippase-like domain-containing protein [Flavobacteriales bacterium]|nr:flippase-like domain-containing protein [Flavobacteriales bacterium]
MGRTLLIIFRWGIFFLACAFIYTQLSAAKGTQALAALRHLRTDGNAPWVLLVMLVCMAVNWSLESHKWRWLLRPVERIGRWRSLVATIAGTSVGLVTPNRTGEFLGRVLFLRPENRVKGSFATALGSIAQFVVTLLTGALALLVMRVLDHQFPWPSGWVTWFILSLTLIVSLGTLLLYLHPPLLRQMLLLVPFLKRLERASSVLNGYEWPELLMVFFLSLARYVVFTAQYVLLLMVFGSGLSIIDALLAVPVVYLLSTLVPTVMLTELGIRGTAAIALLTPLGGSEIAVLLATTVLWSINVVLPALVGSLILLVARIRTERVTE